MELQNFFSSFKEDIDAHFVKNDDVDIDFCNLLKSKYPDIYFLLNQLGGKSFNKGLYRIHSLESSFEWTAFIKQIFPEYSDDIVVISYDWYGRQFAINIKEINLIHMYDPATFEYFNIHDNISEFHNLTITDSDEDLLLNEEFQDWLKVENHLLDIIECVGFKVPLFMNGQESLSNTERINMKFYWEINYKLLNGLGIS